MTTIDHRSCRTVLIPWVIALVTLVGWNAFIPDQARIRKTGSTGEMELSQLADDSQRAGRISSPQVYFTFHTAAGTSTLLSSSRLILIEDREDQAVYHSRAGAIRGRAPPAGQIA